MIPLNALIYGKVKWNLANVNGFPAFSLAVLVKGILSTSIYTGGQCFEGFQCCEPQFFLLQVFFNLLSFPCMQFF